jgi:hypothetical protein
MLFAKVALGFCGSLALLTVYAFHDGVLQVDEEHTGGRHIHVWAPAAIVPVALRVVPKRHFEHAAAEMGPWMPTVRALTKELRKFPDAEFVDVHDANEHVRIATRNGKLMIEVEGPDENVHVACPLAMIEDVTRALEADAPTA